MWLANEQALDLLLVCWRDDLVSVQAARATRGFTLEKVSHTGLLLLQFPATGHLESLLGTRVGFLLPSHRFLLVLCAPPVGGHVCRGESPLRLIQPKFLFDGLHGLRHDVLAGLLSLQLSCEVV